MAAAQDDLGILDHDALGQLGEVLQPDVGAVLDDELAVAVYVYGEVPQHDGAVYVPQGDGSPDGDGGALLPRHADGLRYGDCLLGEGSPAHDDDVPRGGGGDGVLYGVAHLDHAVGGAGGAAGGESQQGQEEEERMGFGLVFHDARWMKGKEPEKVRPNDC